MKKAYVVAARRSAIGSFIGGFTNIPLVDLGAAVLSRTIEEAGIDPANTDEVIVGNATAAGPGQNIGRRVSIKVGVPVKAYARSLNTLRGSGLKVVTEATMRIQYGFGDVFVVDDVESVISAPYLVPSKVRSGVKMGDMKMMGSMLYDGLTDGMYGTHMGVITDNITEKYSISRKGQDTFTYTSQQKAIAAIDSERLQDEIVPVEVPGREGSTTVFDTDEYPNRTSTSEKLAKPRPAFTKDDTVAAGDTSGINDGASFTIIASEDTARKHNLTPPAEVVGIGRGGVDSRAMGLGSTPAILHALEHADLCIEDMEPAESNEAFAAQPLGAIHKLKKATDMDRNTFTEKTSVDGGAIALGHPTGVSGSRILVGLLHEMQKRDLKIGLASLCIGGEQGAAVTIERV